MNEEQKQRMTHELGQWNAAMKSSCSVSDLLAISTRMAALLQDLIDAPEPEQPNQSEQHLEMVKRDLFQARQSLLNEGQQRDALLAALEGLADDIHSLIHESSGVAGLHLNDDLAPWHELEAGGRFERLTHLPIAIEAIAAAKGGA